MIALNTIAVLAYLASGLLILRHYRETVVFYGFFYFMQSWMLVSCWYNDLGIYNNELFRYTDTSFATTRLALFCLLFNVGFVLVARWCQRHPLSRNDYAINWGKPKAGPLKLLLGGAIGLLYAYICFTFYRDGIPILMGIDRLLFVTEGGAVENLLVLYGPYIAFLLGYFRNDDKKFPGCSMMMGSFVVYKILTANKFSGLMAIIVPYYLPIFIRAYLRNNSLTVLKTKYFAFASGAIAVLLTMAFLTYMSVLGSTDGASQFLLDRVLANQGQLWWAVDNDKFGVGGILPDQTDKELNAILEPGSVSSEETGMKVLMIHILGPTLAYPIIDKGYLYTMAYPAILVTMVPYGIAALIQVLAGAFLALCLYYLYYCITYRHLVRALVTLMIVLPLVAVLATGNLTVFLTFGMMVKISFLIFVEGGFVRTTLAGEAA